MTVKNLILENYRNYEKGEFIFDDKLNIIHGNNAQGKTNILEGIYSFSLGKSNRAQKDIEIINFGKDEAKIKMEFSDEKRTNLLEMEISKSKRKKILFNEIPVKKNSEIVGKFNAVYFGPEYLDIIKGGPKKRRKNIDVLISQLRVSYFSALIDLKKILEQKNAALKKETINESIIDILNEQLLKETIIISKLRYEYIKKIEEKAKALQKEISEDMEELSIRYISSVGLIEEFNEELFKEAFEKKLKDIKKKEMAFGECLTGPQRDDIEFKINGLDVKNYASQGQQKTTVLVQKIAEVELFKEEKGEYPVLLLDDITSEFDKKRRDFIIKKINNMQIFITCTDKESLSDFGKGKFFEIEDGKIIKEG